jgi:eukaryotic-like serine/threonine-protein kinase
MTDRDTQTESATARYQNEWDCNANPDLNKFLRSWGPLSTSALAEVLRLDLRQRWQRSQIVPVEHYLDAYPQLGNDEESTIDLIYSEYLVRESLGQTPDLEEFVNRFPLHATQLKSQIQLHHFVEKTELHSASKTIGAIGSSSTIAGRQWENVSGKFGRYEIRRLLGHGGMGDVYLATDTVLQREVALKIPKLHLAREPDNIKRFYREARASALLRHPHICAVFDVGEIEGRHFLTMQYIEGETLSAQIQRQGALTCDHAVNVMQSILDAIELAHKNGILHRDLKPSNIMIDTKNQPIIMDFGLAQLQTSDESQITDGGDFLGTPSFASPEQLRGQSELVGPASDVYSLGAILFQMLTGRPPFTGNAAVVIKQVLDDPAPRPSDLNPSVPAFLDSISQRALAKLPQDRFASAHDFAQALVTNSIGQDSSNTNSAKNPLDRPARSHRRKVLGVILASIALLGSIVIGFQLMDGRNKVAQNDPMPPGSIWRGEFVWEAESSVAGSGADNHPVQLTVTLRNDTHVQAQYLAEKKFEWTVSGSLIDGQLELKFIKSFITGDPQALIETGRLSGKLVGDSIEMIFSDSSDMSISRFVLHRSPDEN